MGEMRNAYGVLIGRHKGKPVRRWEDNIKINLKYYVKMWTGFIWLEVGFPWRRGIFVSS
jgi:hypothetical protein